MIDQHGRSTKKKGVVVGVYQVEVHREGAWWMVHIPEVGGLTQARHIGEAALMAREYLAVSLDIAVEEVEVDVTVVTTDEAPPV